jgi:hypothetical protein
MRTRVMMARTAPKCQERPKRKTELPIDGRKKAQADQGSHGGFQYMAIIM